MPDGAWLRRAWIGDGNARGWTASTRSSSPRLRSDREGVDLESRAPRSHPAEEADWCNPARQLRIYADRLSAQRSREPAPELGDAHRCGRGAPRVAGSAAQGREPAKHPDRDAVGAHVV